MIMDPFATKALKLLREIKSITFATVNKGRPAARIIGDIKFCNNRNIIDEIFEHRPMTNDLYPGEKRDILEGFYLYRGKGEIFDLSAEPPRRERFAFSGETANPPGYFIAANCTACSLCLQACPVDVISEGEIYLIDGSHCLECGRCAKSVRKMPSRLLREFKILKGEICLRSPWRRQPRHPSRC